MNLDVLLSDEFVRFSTDIKDVHERKKALKEEFERAKEQFKQDLKSINDEAQGLQDAFTAWSNSKQEKGSS